MANKIDSPSPLPGRSAYPVEIDKAGADRSAPLAPSAPAAAAHLGTETTSIQVTMPPPAEPVMHRAKIQALRASINDGTYRIDPQEIARRLAALEQELSR